MCQVSLRLLLFFFFLGFRVSGVKDFQMLESFRCERVSGVSVAGVGELGGAPCFQRMSTTLPSAFNDV